MVKVEKVYLNTKNKDDQPYINKNGEHFTRVVLMLDDGRKPSACVYDPAEARELASLEGKEVNLEITESGDFLNFKVPNRLDELEKRIEALEKGSKTVQVQESNGSAKVEDLSESPF